MAVAAVLKNSILLGQILPSNLKGAAVKVQVPYFVFDDRMKAYFKKTHEFVAQDPTLACKTGDVVIIQKIEQQVRSALAFPPQKNFLFFKVFPDSCLIIRWP